MYHGQSNSRLDHKLQGRCTCTACAFLLVASKYKLVNDNNCDKNIFYYQLTSKQCQVINNYNLYNVISKYPLLIFAQHVKGKQFQIVLQTEH